VLLVEGQLTHQHAPSIEVGELASNAGSITIPCEVLNKLTARCKITKQK
jgi:hypothetical protein